MPMKPIPTMPTLTIDVTPVYILVCVFPCFSILPTVLACFPTFPMNSLRNSLCLRTGKNAGFHRHSIDPGQLGDGIWQN